MQIDLEHKKELDVLFKALDVGLSEYSFANCYLFRSVHHYEIRGNFLHGITRDGFSYLLPLVYPFDIYAGPHFFPIPDKWLSLFPKDEFHVQALSQDDDYLFSRDKLQNYPGRKLAGQRNLMYHFEAQNDPQVVAFSEEAALEVLVEWNAIHKDAQNDFEECKEAILKRQVLGLEGVLVVSGREPVGFLLAEKLGSDTYVVHFCKAKSSIKGVTPYLYRFFAKNLPKEILWINLEQDLGSPGLEKAKSSYVPDQHVKKYRVSAISDS